METPDKNKLTDKNQLDPDPKFQGSGESMKDSMSEAPENNDNALIPGADDLTNENGELNADAFKKSYQRGGSITGAKFLVIATGFFFAACGSPNDYDSHANGSDSIESMDAHNDTIQGRSPDSTNTVIDSTNIGVGDTTLEKTH